MIRIILAVAGIFAVTPLAHAQQPPETAVLFQNVRIFDGEASALSAPSNVLVRGNTIERISTSAIASDGSANTRIIDGGGRTLMPGLIDAHWHAILVRPAQ
jgi:imidazolonepropionase-like amidohydrolase